jgi:type VI secretion system protein ImpM
MTVGDFPTGWYGKISSTGDFIVRRVPPAFVAAWDEWLGAALKGSRERLAGQWLDRFLTMPPWRFVLGAGMVSTGAWAGLLVPSVDAVGRYFPMTVVASLPSASLDLVQTMHNAQAWFEDIESVALEAIAPGAKVAAIDAALAAQPFDASLLAPPAKANADDTVPLRSRKPQMLAVPLGAAVAASAWRELRALASRLVEPSCVWLAEPSDVFGACLLAGESLPPAEEFCALLDGHWSEHGWSRRELDAPSEQEV